MGTKLILRGMALDNPSAPPLPDIDLILPKQGALMFLDPSHPVQQWGTMNLNSTDSVDASAVRLPNLAYAQAKALIPTGTEATLNAKYFKEAGLLNDGVASKLERTGKGALHVIFSQASGNTAFARYARIGAMSAINAYLLANKAHSFYAAFWGRITRGAKQYSTGAPMHSYGNSNNTLFGFYTRPTSAAEIAYPTTNPPRTSFSQEGAYSTVGKTNTPLFQDIAVSNANAAATALLMPWNFSADAGANGLMQGSMIFYGFYMEDLTVSGRTYAQVNALVKAKYDKDVKTAGGRYYGDTFTDPATMP